MFKEILFALWFFLPAGMANVTPILVAPIPGLKKLTAPMDFGRTFHRKRVLGAHKTWRGLVAGVSMSTLTLWLQQLAVAHFGWAHTLASSVDYAAFPTLVLGVLFGVGALGGDAVESFFKRQRGTPPGQGWFPWDQLDYIIGAALASLPFVALSLTQYAILIILWLVVHLVASYVGWLLHLKERPI
ncbi:MAG TPA: CDP-archaeol synthase [Candidatus Saccharimonadales bacterium]|nr:CDP-archaeol synthase [Candidatus Saccharimonadales bacterium]